MFRSNPRLTLVIKMFGKYLEVFKGIFDKTDNLGYYNMMMKIKKE